MFNVRAQEDAGFSGVFGLVQDSRERSVSDENESERIRVDRSGVFGVRFVRKVVDDDGNVAVGFESEFVEEDDLAGVMADVGGLDLAGGEVGGGGDEEEEGEKWWWFERWISSHELSN